MAKRARKPDANLPAWAKATTWAEWFAAHPRPGSYKDRNGRWQAKGAEIPPLPPALDWRTSREPPPGFRIVACWCGETLRPPRERRPCMGCHGRRFIGPEVMAREEDGRVNLCSSCHVPVPERVGDLCEACGLPMLELEGRNYWVAVVPGVYVGPSRATLGLSTPATRYLDPVELEDPSDLPDLLRDTPGMLESD